MGKGKLGRKKGDFYDETFQRLFDDSEQTNLHRTIPKRLNKEFQKHYTHADPKLHDPTTHTSK